MSLPSGIQYYPAPDGSARLIDIGAAAIVTSASEQAMGMTWWNKALLTGSGLGTNTRNYNNVRATGQSGIVFRAGCWPYKCPDGTVYLMWYSTVDKRIRAEKAILPTATVPANETGGVSCLDLSASVVSAGSVSGASYPLYHWLNFAPNGKKAALHFGLSRNSGLIQDTYQIFEIDVSGGSASAAPVVTLSLYRQLETGGLYNLFQEFPDYQWFQGPSDIHPVQQPVGNDTQRATTVLFVDYNLASARIEVSFKNESATVFTPVINSSGHSTINAEGDHSFRVMVNGAPALTFKHFTVSRPDDYNDTVVTHLVEQLGNLYVVNGNLAVVATADAIVYSSSGVASGSATFYGLVGANAVIGDAKSAIATSLSVSDLAVDPLTGAFTSGRTRFF